MNRRELTHYALAVVVSLTVKVVLSIVNFVYGFKRANHTLIEIDGSGYTQEASLGIIHMEVGQHWVYRWMNHRVLEFTQDPGALYLHMSLLNVLLSSLIPLVAFPVFHKLTGGATGRRTAAFVAFVWLALLWPSSLWLATQNLKDVTVALLVLLFFVGIIFLTSTSGIRALGGVLIVSLSIWLLLGLRQYLPFLLLLGALPYLFSHNSSRVAWKGLLVAGLLLAPLFGTVLAQHLDPRESWLLNADARADLNARLTEGGGTELSVSTSPPALVIGFVRGMFNPFPNVRVDSVYDILIQMRTVFVLCTSFFVVQHVAHRSWPGRSLLVTASAASLAFFSIFPGVVGPRHAFSMFDLAYLIIFSVVVVERPRIATWLPSVGVGILGSIALLVLTARAIV